MAKLVRVQGSSVDYPPLALERVRSGFYRTEDGRWKIYRLDQFVGESVGGEIYRHGREWVAESGNMRTVPLATLADAVTEVCRVIDENAISDRRNRRVE